jgi:hypothetical protein
MKGTTVQEERDRRLGLWADLERNDLTTKARPRLSPFPGLGIAVAGDPHTEPTLEAAVAEMAALAVGRSQ